MIVLRVFGYLVVVALAFGVCATIGAFVTDALMRVGRLLTEEILWGQPCSS